MAFAYHPTIAARAVEELTNALLGLKDMEYANALLADPRMTHTKGLLASCGLTYKGIKKIRDSVSGNIPTLEAQRRALDFLGTIDTEQKHMIQQRVA